MHFRYLHTVAGFYRHSLELNSKIFYLKYGMEVTEVVNEDTTDRIYVEE